MSDTYDSIPTDPIYNFGLLVEVVVMMNWKTVKRCTTLPITAIKLEAILLDLLSAIQ